jgi:hypothetical protein
VNVTVQNSTFTSSRGDLFQMGHTGSGSADLVFTGNNLSNNHTNIATGGGGVTISGGGAGSMTLNVDGNTFRDARGNAVSIVKDIGSGSLTGAFSNNTIGVLAVVNSGSLEGSGLRVNQQGQGTLTLAITNNQIRQYNNDGILLQAGAGTSQPGSFNTTISGNTVSTPGINLGGVFNGLHLNNGVTPGDSFQTCTKIESNTLTASGRNGGTDFRLRQRQATTVRLPGYAGANNDNTAVVAFVQGNNSPLPTGTAANTVPTGGGFVGGGSTCP